MGSYGPTKAEMQEVADIMSLRENSLNIDTMKKVFNWFEKHFKPPSIAEMRLLGVTLCEKCRHYGTYGCSVPPNDCGFHKKEELVKVAKILGYTGLYPTFFEKNPIGPKIKKLFNYFSSKFTPSIAEMRLLVKADLLKYNPLLVNLIGGIFNEGMEDLESDD